ncbi:MAG: threonine synthase [Halobacteriaceae archaeon]
MQTTTAFSGLTCTDCGGSHGAADAPGRCPDCGGALDPTYDYDAVGLTRATLADRPFDSLWRYDDLLPAPREAAVSTGEGATPLVACPQLAAELGVGRVLVKDEGHNPTGTAADRGLSVAVTAAAGGDVSDVALASPGDDGQSAAAYGARAGLDVHAFLPSRSGFVRKAMVNVHGGDMTVVEGRADDAKAALADALDENEGWHSLQPFTTPYRHEGLKTALFELVEQDDWRVPDHVVYPTGEGAGPVAAWKAARELVAVGLVDETPAVHAAQAEGCAPLVRAFEADRDVPDPWERPDTIAGGVEIPDPAGGRRALEAVRESGGRAVAAADDGALASAVTVAQREGVESGVSGGVAAAGAWELAAADAFDPDDTVVVVNPVAGNKDADVLRSHLMSRGI